MLVGFAFQYGQIEQLRAERGAAVPERWLAHGRLGVPQALPKEKCPRECGEENPTPAAQTERHQLQQWRCF